MSPLRCATSPKHAKAYRAFETYPRGSFEEQFFYRLRAMETATATPVLLKVLALEDEAVATEQKFKLMRVIESYLVRRMVCRLTTKNYNLIFLALLDRIHEDPSMVGDVALEYFSSLATESRYWPTDEEVEYQLISLPIYRLLSRGRLRDASRGTGGRHAFAASGGSIGAARTADRAHPSSGVDG